MKRVVEFSQEALDVFKQHLVSQQAKLIRLGVKGGSCNGLQYVIEFENTEPRQDDNEWSDNGVTFVVDKKSEPLLSGSRVTWTKTLMIHGFDFENPNESSRCGCGRSFSVK